MKHCCTDFVEHLEWARGACCSIITVRGQSTVCASQVKCCLETMPLDDVQGDLDGYVQLCCSLVVQGADSGIVVAGMP
eukprot:1269436-Rhodomonas_salina.1